MTMPARQLVAKSLRFMICTLFSVRAFGAPHTLGTNGERHWVQTLRKTRALSHLCRLSNCRPATNQMTRMNLPILSVVVLRRKRVRTTRNSDRAWLALAAGVTAYDLIANDAE